MGWSRRRAWSRDAPVIVADGRVTELRLCKGCARPWPQRTGGFARSACNPAPLAPNPLRTSVQVNLESSPAFYRGGYIVPRRERPRRSTWVQVRCSGPAAAATAAAAAAAPAAAAVAAAACVRGCVALLSPCGDGRRPSTPAFRAVHCCAVQANDPLTLVVALDGSGAAKGDLYLDDGRSYAFLRGQYAHRWVRFWGPGMVCGGAHSPWVLPKGRRTFPAPGSRRFHPACRSAGACPPPHRHTLLLPEPLPRA